MTTAKAYGRVGLLGNPSDIYGGKGISFTFDKHAQVHVQDSAFFKINGNGGSDNTLFYTGNNDLIKATINYLGLQEKARNLEISYESHIPLGSGLAGSSAIIIATIKALNEHLSLNMDKFSIAEAALHTEIEEMKIASGPQDRYAISFGGLVHLDLTGKEFLRKTDPYGKVTPLKTSEMPFFLCLGMKPKSSAMVHNPLREEFLMGGERAKQIKADMDKIALLADLGLKPLEEKDWKTLGELMNKNSELRNKLCSSSNADNEMIRKALEYGAYGAKLAGSGGAVIVLGEESVFDKMICEYPCLKPKIARYEE